MIYILHQPNREPIRIQSKLSCLWRIFFHKFCLQQILFTTKSCLRHTFLQTKIYVDGAFDFSFLFGFQFTGIGNDLNWLSAQSRFHSNQNHWIAALLLTHNPSHSVWPWRLRANSFEKTKSLTQRCVRAGCQLNSNKALRSLFLKGHVRARDSMLWRHLLTRSEWILVYWNTSFFREVSNQKIAQNPRKCFLRRANNDMLSKSLVTRDFSLSFGKR